MKLQKTLAFIAALVMMLATVHASASGQTYDPYDNYYSAFYSIDMKSTEIVTHDSNASSAAPQKRQQVTPIDVEKFSDPRNFYNW